MRVLAVAVCLLATAPNVAATAATFLLNLTNSAGVPSSTPPYGTVTLIPVMSSSGQVGMQFTVSSLISGFVINALGFNSKNATHNVISLHLASFSSNLPGNSSTFLMSGGSWGIPMDGFGRFNYVFTSGLLNCGSHFPRTFSFTVYANQSNINLDTWNFMFGSKQKYATQPSVFFSAYVHDAYNRSFIAGSTVAPEPGSVLLLGTGVLVLGALPRRKSLRKIWHSREEKAPGSIRCKGGKQQ